MYPDPRWRKVFRDLWRSKARAILVVLSIAVGVFAVGAVAHMRIIVSKEYAESYASANPADAVVYTNQSFDDDLVQVVRRIEGVRDAEGVTSTTLRFHREGEEQWHSITVFAVSDFQDQRINVIGQEAKYIADDTGHWVGGKFPPSNRELLVDRTSLLMPTQGFGNARLDDTLIVQTLDGREREMVVTGVAHDYARAPATFSGMARGYVTLETLEWLGGSREFNELNLLVDGNPRDVASIQMVADRVREKIESSGRTVERVQTNTPGEAPLNFVFDALSLILGVLGFVSLFLSAFLVINTITALLSQQVRQIGVMKAVGGTASQIAGMYLVLVVIFGLVSLLIAMPVAVYVTEYVVNFLAYFLNFRPPTFRIPAEVIALEVAMALLVPTLAAFFPVIASTRMTVREAIASYGISGGKAQMTDRRDQPSTMNRRLAVIPRPLMLSLRNTFRRRSRVAFTMTTLILGTALFVAVLSVRTSLYFTLDAVLKYWQFDIQANLKQPYPVQRLEDVALSIPGISKMEAWGMRATFRLRPDGTQSKGLAIMAVPADTKMWRPTMLQGRWLTPDDENVVVVDTHFTQDNPDVKVGDEIVLKVEGDETTWQVVGIFQGMPMMSAVAHVNYSYFARFIHEPERSSFIGVATDKHDSEYTSQISRNLEEEFKQASVNFSSALTNTQLRQGITILFDIVIYFLMVMAILIAVVGGLGLTGTMSLNVLERTREIGVMRAIGASDAMIQLIVIAEGLLIGGLSWLIGTVIALPLGKLLTDAVGMGFLNSAVNYTFSIDGALACLIGMLVIAGISSWFPAQNASRLTVREVLAYDG